MLGKTILWSRLCCLRSVLSTTVNWEIFVVEIFSYSMLCTKIKRTKLKRMRALLTLTCSVRGRLYENDTKRKIIARNITRNIYDLR